MAHALHMFRTDNWTTQELQHTLEQFEHNHYPSGRPHSPAAEQGEQQEPEGAAGQEQAAEPEVIEISDSDTEEEPAVEEAPAAAAVDEAMAEADGADQAMAAADAPAANDLPAYHPMEQGRYYSPTYMSIDHYDVYGKYTWSVTGGAGRDHQSNLQPAIFACNDKVLFNLHSAP
jgi:hypothetical protein